METVKTGGSDPLEQVIVRILGRSSRHPISVKRLHVEIARECDSQKAPRVSAALDGLVRSGAVLIFEDGREPECFLAGHIDALKARLCAVVRAHHSRHPYEAGIKISEIRKGFSETRTLSAKRNIDARLFAVVFSACTREGLVLEGEGGVRMPGFLPRSRADAEIAGLEAAIRAYLQERPFQKTSLEHLAAFLGIEVRKLKAILAGMLKARALIEVEDGRFMAPEELESVERSVIAMLGGGRRMHLTEIAAALGRSRTAVQPVVDHLDRIGLTRRVGDLRELAAAKVDPPR